MFHRSAPYPALSLACRPHTNRHGLGGHQGVGCPLWPFTLSFVHQQHSGVPVTITLITTSPCLSAYYIYVCPVLVVWGWRAHIARYQHLESHNGTNWPGLFGKKDEFGYQEALALYPVFSAQVWIRRLLSVVPTLLPSRRIPLTGNSCTIPFLSRTPRSPRGTSRPREE